MYCWWKPSPERLRAFLADQSDKPFTYDAVGATAGQPPAGFAPGRLRVRLGSGETVFERAKGQLRGWRQFGLSWVEIFPNDTPIEAGRVVAVIGRVFALRTVNACRVIEVVDEPDASPARFGFRYGTLPGHVGSGEEWFLVEWMREDDSVWYEIAEFSRPHQWPAKLASPLMRFKQRQFKRESAAVMQRLVSDARQSEEASPVRA